MYFHLLYNQPYLFAYSALNASMVGQNYYLSTRSFIVDLSLLNNHFNSQNDVVHAINDSFNHLLPMAVRHYSESSSSSWYLVERPPFKTKIDFSTSKSYNKRKINKHIQNLEIWIPWTLVAIHIPNNTRLMGQMKFHIYMNDSQLNSFDEPVIPCFFPNSSTQNGSICIGDTLGRHVFEESDFSIKEISNLIFNDYFTGGWNSDILSSILYTEVFIDIFQKLEDEQDKFYLSSSLPNLYHELKKASRTSTKNPSVATYGMPQNYVDFFYAYSFMTLDQVLLYFNQLKQKKSSATSSIRYLFPGNITSSQPNYYENYNRMFSPYKEVSLNDSIDKLFNLYNFFYNTDHSNIQYSYHFSKNIVINNYDESRHNLADIVSHPKIISSIYTNLYGNYLNRKKIYVNSQQLDVDNLINNFNYEFDANSLIPIGENSNV